MILLLSWIIFVPVFFSRLFPHDPFSTHLEQTRWNAMWRSMVHCVSLLFLVFLGYIEHAIHLFFIYIVHDFGSAFIEVDGDLKWDNWLHHGTCAFLSSIPILDDTYLPLAIHVAPSLFMMEWSTIFLNLSYMASFLSWKEKSKRFVSILFVISFTILRCLFVPFLILPLFPTFPILAQFFFSILFLLQWVWLGLICKKLLTTQEKKNTKLS